ncbi:hypothetical protein OEZ62_20120 [Escherichia coli]|nr:hypothetical protein [Escherichia coli]
MFAGKKSAQIREILISESAWEEMTCLFAPSLDQQRVLNALQTERLHAGAQRLSQEREQYEEEVKFKEEFSSS